MISSLRTGLATAATHILVLLVNLFVLEEEVVAPLLLLALVGLERGRSLVGVRRGGRGKGLAK